MRKLLKRENRLELMAALGALCLAGVVLLGEAGVVGFGLLAFVALLLALSSDLVNGFRR